MRGRSDGRRARGRRPVLPPLRERRVRRAALRARDPVQAREQRPARDRDDRGARDAGALLLQPRSQRAAGSVEVDGLAAEWSRTTQDLEDHARTTARRRRPVHRRGSYRGVPRPFVLPGTTIPSGFIHTSDGFIVAGEPESAATWFPVNDHPTDPATYSFRVTVPAGLQVVANGVRERVASNGDRRTHVWQVREPMASYLATVDVGEFRLRFDETGRRAADRRGPPRPRHRVDDALARQPSILSFLESQFGTYPFESVGAIVTHSRKLGFALETQTAADLSPVVPRGGPRDRPRARAPVVRRSDRGRALAAHLAERGLRDVRGVALVRGPGTGHDAGAAWTPSTASPRNIRSGAWSSGTRARTTCSTTPCTRAAR